MSLGLYDVGATTFYSCQYDQRFSYCLYVPSQARSQVDLPVCVVVHGSRRTAERYRDLFADFAERYGCVVLSPLFPVGVPDVDDLSGYKYLIEKGVRYDLILLAMLDEVGQRFPVSTEKFFLHGFSGGGQFAHRFFYLYPERLQAVSIGAPGVVTLPTKENWWMGLSDIKELFGININFDTICSVPVQILVGEQDLDGSEINLTPESRYWQPDCNQAGKNRLERAKTLAKHLEGLGCSVDLDIVSGLGHEGYPLIPRVEAFFADRINTGEACFEQEFA